MMTQNKAQSNRELGESRDITPPPTRDITSPSTRDMSPSNPNQTGSVSDSTWRQNLTVWLVFMTGSYSTRQLVDRMHKMDRSKKIDATWWLLFFATNLFITFPVLCLVGALGRWKRARLVVEEGETDELLV
ncbi:hypothetical protein B0I72DRAFT_82249 [Yarrowia lipolytica]|jgi:hypothetical protein|uniref:YALI0C02255p n=2 Tax=Yarrowia lipolytica TaxID=4952 RepID=Q6CDA9_YARLI|nr:YALI0C02255p [Yarrowia lipolytica CLIB122]AOW02228.1 hypothetical protein YALI1_C03221g [Yarrowia lipolytica]KAB8283561.1 hypothetical protein BKA91DRAFT_82938 [Yarrowia lipolytica]KAE8172050.1 hypothetical protein BKA90DRAFT_146969 [Yarrowia lipolytica]KAJ8052970.1 hypothetical protein LXG23DRAFT_54559 [Yarrowia lipolytica]RDW26909.1 hypothetical protein B0I71DRAFT_152022 [Yarrowia lipolytica]|eukprot:XP_501353.2 YALI0C02255p [Yarrowia lipolytica CLIB122]